MIEFNVHKYKCAKAQMGLEESTFAPLEELIKSEINYINHFLYYLNDQDINELLVVYDQRHFVQLPQETNQESLRYIYNSLKRLKKAQYDSFCFYNSSHTWADCLNALLPYYLEYIRLIHHAVFPQLVEDKFKLIQAQKTALGHPEQNRLAAILFAPVQRMPRYKLLAEAILKELQKQLPTLQGENLTAAQTHLKGIQHFLLTTNKICTQINQHLWELDQDEPTSPYFQPSGRIKSLANDLEAPPTDVTSQQKMKRTYSMRTRRNFL